MGDAESLIGRSDLEPPPDGGHQVEEWRDDAALGREPWPPP